MVDVEHLNGVSSGRPLAHDVEIERLGARHLPHESSVVVALGNSRIGRTDAGEDDLGNRSRIMLEHARILHMQDVAFEFRKGRKDVRQACGLVKIHGGAEFLLFGRRNGNGFGRSGIRNEHFETVRS